MNVIGREIGALGHLLVSLFDVAVFWLLGLPGVYVAMTVSAGVTRRLLRRHGRASGRRAFAVVFSGLSLLAYSLCCAVIISNLPSRLGLSAGWLPPVLRAPFGIIGIAVFSGFCVVVAAAILPPRRRTGPSSRRNDIAFRAIRWLGVLIQICAVPAAAALVVQALRTHRPGLLFVLYALFAAAVTVMMVLLIGGWVILGAERLSLGPPSIIFSAGVPVLFLRSFDDEVLTFRAGADVTRLDTFEGFLSETVAGLLGPLKALGNPRDRIEPAGADRSYYSDAGWQRQVEDLMEKSSCILAVPSSSRSVIWELTYVKNHRYHEKLFVLTPPAAPELGTYWTQGISNRWARAVVARTSQLTVSLYQGHYRDLFRVGKKRQRATWAVGRYSWTDWAATLATAGYQAGADPGHGAVVTFNVEGQAVVLVQGATEPEEFVLPIQRRLKPAGTT